MQIIDFHPAIKLALEHFALKDQDSIHGLGHWGRVLENGMRLAEQTGADMEVVALFAVFHDCQRVDDSHDIHHGPRAAKLIYKIAGQLGLGLDRTALLASAVAGHTNCFHSMEPTIATCWDADRLDIPRIGGEDNPVLIDPRFLSTEAACDPEVLAWAQERAEQAQVPTFVIPYL